VCQSEIEMSPRRRRLREAPTVLVPARCAGGILPVTCHLSAGAARHRPASLSASAEVSAVEQCRRQAVRLLRVDRLVAHLDAR
jgi:hypothetical protein